MAKLWSRFFITLPLARSMCALLTTESKQGTVRLLTAMELQDTCFGRKTTKARNRLGWGPVSLSCLIWKQHKIVSAISKDSTPCQTQGQKHKERWSVNQLKFKWEKKNTAYTYYYIQQYYIKQHRQDYSKQSSQCTCQTTEKDPRDSQTIQPWSRGQGTSMNVGVQAYLLRRVWVCSLSSRLISRQEMIRQHPPLNGPNRIPKSWVSIPIHVLGYRYEFMYQKETEHGSTREKLRSPWVLMPPVLHDVKWHGEANSENSYVLF